MRGTIGKAISNPNTYFTSNAAKHNPFLISSFSSFSTSSTSGGGRGRGRGGGPSGAPSRFDFTRSPTPGAPDSTSQEVDSLEPPPGGLGHGRGRGRPIPSSPIPPAFSSFVPSIERPPSSGTGRGRAAEGIANQHGEQRFTYPGPPRTPLSTQKVERREEEQEDAAAESPPRSKAAKIPEGVASALSGAGRGKPVKKEKPAPPIKEENRHIKPKLSREEAVKKAVQILSRGGEEKSEVSERGRGGGRFGRGRAMQEVGRGRGWRGRGSGRGRGRGRGRGSWRESEERDTEEGYGSGLYLGDNADGEKLARRLGLETMNKLVEGFEEMGDRVLPSPLDDAYVDALHTNYSIEFEPEYLMESCDTNPDIDEKPPMSLRDALEKVKPFLMAYEGIQSQEEWEEVMKETMENVPLLKEIVDQYSGPDRVTAKKQQEELERVAKTIPESAPASVKRFADRAVLSLQSNPGWGFDKKCQFMDKLAWEVSQHYK